MLRSKVGDALISSNIELQMTGAVERKDRALNIVLAGVVRIYIYIYIYLFIYI